MSELKGSVPQSDVTSVAHNYDLEEEVEEKIYGTVIY
jgi:hypothetical protein